MASSGSGNTALKIKICGVTRPEDARAAALAGAHALGLNFVPESPRRVRDIPSARLLVERANVAAHVRWAGVFVNPSLEDILRTVEGVGLRIVQLHGEETAAFVEKVRMSVGAGTEVWKAFRVSAERDLAALTGFPSDAWLVDAKCDAVRGGSGKAFDWSILATLQRTRPLVLAGGLNPANVAEAVRRVRPDWVDTASGVESSPGIKDAALLAQFVNAARSAQGSTFSL